MHRRLHVETAPELLRRAWLDGFTRVPPPTAPVARQTPGGQPQVGPFPVPPGVGKQWGPTADPSQQKPVQNLQDYFQSITGGLAKGVVVGVYDGGGILPAGGIAINASKRPEPVFNHEQWGVLQDNIARIELGEPDPSAMGGGRDYSVHFHDTVVKDVGEMLREADSRSRLQMMRHAGRP